MRLVGVLGAEPELLLSSCILKLRVKTPDGEWHRVVATDARALSLVSWLHAGDVVVVEGSLRTSKYVKGGENRYVTDIVASRVLRRTATRSA